MDLSSSSASSGGLSSPPPVEVKAPCLKRLSSIDKFFLDLEKPSQLMTIAGMWIFEECPSEEAIIAELERWVAMFPVFRHRLSGRRWVEAQNFSVRDHLRVVTLPSPGGKRELQEYISTQMSTPFDLNRPLWVANLIRGFNGKGGAYYVSLHHCISDGQGTIRMVLSLTTSSEEEKLAGAGHTVKGRHALPTKGSPKHSSTKRLETSVKASPLGQLPGASSLWRLLEATGLLLLLALALSFLEKLLQFVLRNLRAALKWIQFVFRPKRVLNLPGGPTKHMAYSDLLDLEEVKAVGHAAGATLNDVLISNLTSTLREYLLSSGDLAKEPEISCAVPVSVRRPDDWQLGNKVCLVLLKLPVHLEDPVERLRVVKARLDEIKGSLEVTFSYSITRLVFTLLPQAVLSLFTRVMTKRYHVLLTNVPGPKFEISFAGKPVKEYHAFVPQPSEGGMGLAVMTYNGKVSLAVNVDAGHLKPGPEAFLEGFGRQFEILKREVQRRTEPSKKPHSA